MSNVKIKPILKWPGGKEREIPHIFKALPKEIENYYEPFVGGGAVFVNIDAKKYFINDKATELANLYRTIKSDNLRSVFIDKITNIDNAWFDIGSFVKVNRFDLENIYADYKKDLFSLKLKASITDFLDKNEAYFSSVFMNPFNQGYANFKKELYKNLYSKFTRMQVLESRKGNLPEEDIILNIESAVKSGFYMHMRFLLNRMQEIGLDPVDQTVVFYFIRNYAYSGMFRYNKNC
jgi:DNA adenine methylase